MSERQVLLVGRSESACSGLQFILSFIGQHAETACVDRLSEYIAREDRFFCVIICPQSDSDPMLIEEVAKVFSSIPLILSQSNTQHVKHPAVFDVIQEPYQQTQLLSVLHHCQEQRSKLDEKSDLPLLNEISNTLVGKSAAMQRLRRLICQVIDSDVNVLILGESGTGKEVVARQLHLCSSRKQGLFVPVNCAAIPSELLESELFGHEKGAFTGAFSTRKGRFELAIGGTIFLDEIGDMPLAMQVKLLRVLQERCFERVGGNKSIKADVRVIAATHRNLEDAIREEKFREDLYYRLNVFPLEIPPLRDRIEDLPLLINSFVKRLGKRQRCNLRMTQRAVEALGQYRWPGNIRELANLVERLMVLFPNGIVDVSDLPQKYRPTQRVSDLQTLEKEAAPQQKPISLTAPLSEEGVNLREYLRNTESAFIRQALDSCDGVVARAAAYLGIQRTTLVEKMRKYGIKRRDAVSVEEMA